MQECRDETEIDNYQGIQPSNNKLINAILGGTLDLPWIWPKDKIKLQRLH